MTKSKAGRMVSCQPDVYGDKFGLLIEGEPPIAFRTMDDLRAYVRGQRIKLCHCRPPKRHAACGYCGDGYDGIVCGRCSDHGIDGGVIRGTERKTCRAHQIKMAPPLTPSVRRIARDVANEQYLCLAGRRLLHEYLRGPRNCNRFDSLPYEVQDAARECERRMGDNE